MKVQFGKRENINLVCNVSCQRQLARLDPAIYQRMPWMDTKCRMSLHTRPGSILAGQIHHIGAHRHFLKNCPPNWLLTFSWYLFVLFSKLQIVCYEVYILACVSRPGLKDFIRTPPLMKTFLRGFDMVGWISDTFNISKLWIERSQEKM